MEIGALYATLGADISQLKAAVEQAEGTLRRYARETDRELSKASRTWRRFSDSAARDVSAVTHKLESVKRALLSVQGAVAQIGIGLTLGRVIAEARQYSVALTDMAKVTDRSMEEIERDINQLAGRGFGSATALLRGYYQVISAGVSESTEALKLLETASKAALAAHIDQASMIRVLTALMTAYGDELRDAATAADLLYATERYGKTTVAELVPVLGTTATLAANVGLSAHEMAGALALVTQTTGSTSEAATELEAVLNALINPTTQMTRLFERFGGTMAAVKRLGFVETLRQINRAAQGSVEALREILGGRKEATLGFLALRQDDFARVTNLIDSVIAGAGSAQAAWDRWSEGFSGSLQRAVDSISDAMADIGKQMLPLIAELLRQATPLITAFGERTARALRQITESGVREYVSDLIKGLRMLAEAIKLIVVYNLAVFFTEVVVAITRLVPTIWRLVRAIAALDVAVGALTAVSLPALVGGLAVLGVALYDVVRAANGAQAATEGMSNEQASMMARAAETVRHVWRATLIEVQQYFNDFIFTLIMSVADVGALLADTILKRLTASGSGVFEQLFSVLWERADELKRQMEIEQQRHTQKLRELKSPFTAGAAYAHLPGIKGGWRATGPSSSAAVGAAAGQYQLPRMDDMRELASVMDSQAAAYEKLLARLKLEISLIGQDRATQEAMTAARELDIAVGSQQYEQILALARQKEQLSAAQSVKEYVAAIYDEIAALKAEKAEQEALRLARQHNIDTASIEYKQLLEALRLHEQVRETIERKRRAEETVAQVERDLAVKIESLVVDEYEARRRELARWYEETTRAYDEIGADTARLYEYMTLQMIEYDRRERESVLQRKQYSAEYYEWHRRQLEEQGATLQELEEDRRKWQLMVARGGVPVRESVYEWARTGERELGYSLLAERSEALSYAYRSPWQQIFGGTDTDLGERFAGGLEIGLDEARAAFSDFAAFAAKSVSALAETISSSMSGAFTDIIMGTAGVKEAFANMGKAIVEMLVEIIMRMLVMYMLQQLISGIGSMFGIGGPKGAQAMPAGPWAQWTGPGAVTPFSISGGVPTIGHSGGIVATDRTIKAYHGALSGEAADWPLCASDMLPQIATRYHSGGYVESAPGVRSMLQMAVESQELASVLGRAEKFHIGGQTAAQRAQLLVSSTGFALKADEVPAILQVGEVVIDKARARKFAGILRYILSTSRYHEGGYVADSTAADIVDALDDTAVARMAVVMHSGGEVLSHRLADQPIEPYGMSEGRDAPMRDLASIGAERSVQPSSAPPITVHVHNQTSETIEASDVTARTDPVTGERVFDLWLRTVTADGRKRRQLQNIVR